MSASRVANSETFNVSTPSPREIRLTRLFDAPRLLVWDVLHNAEHIRHWWGALGEGYSVPVCEIDFRVGGKWRFINQTAKGERAEFYGEYFEIDAPGRVVSSEVFAPFPESPSRVTTVLTEEDSKTRITLTAEYPSPEVRDMVLGTGMERGAALSYDQIEVIAARLAGN